MKMAAATRLPRRRSAIPKCKRADFERLEHSVYLGRERLGRCSRIGQKLYAAFDAKDRLLGRFKRLRNAYAAVSRESCAAQRSAPFAKEAGQ
jgi:hypothetical protein